MRALVIAHEPDCHGGRVTERLVQRGFDVVTHVVTPDPGKPDRPDPWPDLAGFDLLVPMGSERSLTRKHEISSWVDIELGFLRDAHESGVPVFGVCFGGQLLAEAHGGTVEVSPVTELGWFDLSDGDGHNPAGAGPWFAWHHDRFSPPADAVTLARTDVAVHLFRLGRSVGTQFHPEVDVGVIETWLDASDDAYLAEYGVDRVDVAAACRRHEAAAIERSRALVDWFLDDVAFPDGAARSFTRERTAGR